MNESENPFEKFDNFVQADVLLPVYRGNLDCDCKITRYNKNKKIIAFN
jgi:hypothetical protein